MNYFSEIMGQEERWCVWMVLQKANCVRFVATQVSAQSPTKKKNKEMRSKMQGLDEQTTGTTLNRISGVDINGADASKD